ncbi:nucleoporin, partial [Thalictrum thalictroides]
DQAIVIVSELCETNKSKQIPPEIRDVCLLLLQILDKSLHLEFCVAQSCGIRPVLGRLEDFSKGFKLLLLVAEEHTFLETSLKSLRRIISFVYPGMLQTDGLIQ